MFHRRTAWLLPLLAMVLTHFTRAEESGPTFSFYGYPHQPWKFDHAQGFTFNELWLGGRVVDGAFFNCELNRRGNRYGNVGEIIGDYDTAEIKILFFGSSYTVSEMTNQVQTMLSERLGKSVSILNFWRDSTGFQNNFDIAREVAGKFNPDLIIVASNSLGYAFPRVWRPIIPQGDHFWHWYQSRDADPVNIDPTRAYLQPFVITDLVTREWCEKMNAAKQAGDEQALREDPVVPRMIEEYGRIMEIKERMVNEHGRPVMSVQLDDWNKDARLVENVKYIEGLAIPFLVVHVQTLPEFELKKGGYVFKGLSVTQERGLARAASFEQVIGRKVIHLVDYYDPKDLEDPVKLMTSEKNWHPGENGRRAMAEAFVRLLMEKKGTDW